METKQIISWLLDKAARAQDHSYARMLNMAAKRLQELDQEQKWISVTNGDKFRAMCDEEIACFLAGKFTDSTTQRMMELGKMRSATEISAEADLWFRVWMQWLRMPVEVDHES